MVRKQVGALVDKDLWTVLKTHCVRNDQNIIDIAGQIIEEWIRGNCEIAIFETYSETPIQNAEPLTLPVTQPGS